MPRYFKEYDRITKFWYVCEEDGNDVARVKDSQIADALIECLTNPPHVRKIYRCVVACYNADGEPDLFFVKVRCLEEQFDEGYHCAAAEQAAKQSGYEGDKITFNETDRAGMALMPLFEWDSASIVDVSDR